MKKTFIVLVLVAISLMTFTSCENQIAKDEPIDWALWNLYNSMNLELSNTVDKLITDNKSLLTFKGEEDWYEKVSAGDYKVTLNSGETFTHPDNKIKILEFSRESKREADYITQEEIVKFIVNRKTFNLIKTTEGWAKADVPASDDSSDLYLRKDEIVKLNDKILPY